MKKVWIYIIGFFFLVLVNVWLAVFSTDQNLHLIACDVGQGDAILVTYKSTQILTDGGPNDKILDCLSNHIPFWDRTIEMVILTHPQKDHYGGLTDVMRVYKVKTFVKSEVGSSSRDYQLLESLIGGGGTKVIKPELGMTIRLGLIYLDILNPSPTVLENKNRDLNDYSVVYNLKYDDFEALLTGDISPAIIAEILLTGEIKDVEYIKIPHHGSKNGLTRELLEASRPEIAVISVGEGNSYGHPHKEILEMLKEITVERTDISGDVEVLTDGESWWKR